MSAYSKGLTRYPDIIKHKAREMFGEGVSVKEITKQLAISSDVVVRRWVDEGYRRAYNERARNKRNGLL